MALSFKKLDSLRIDFLVERELLEFFVSFSDEVFFLEELFLDDLEFILHLDHVFLFLLEGVEMFLELFQFEVPPFIAFFELLQLFSEVKYLIFDSKLFLVQEFQFFGFRNFKILKLVLNLRLSLL